MTTAVEPKILLEWYHRHAQAEARLDLGATMETVSPEAVYELWPRGHCFTERAAISEFYRRVFAGFFPLRVGAAAEFEPAFGDAHIAVESYVTVRYEPPVRPDSLGPDGDESVLRVMSVARFEPDAGLLLGETVYMDEEMVALIDGALGEDFFRLPGVTTLKS